MNDFKNILLAWTSSVTFLFAAVESSTVITIISAIVLPVVFFAVGKSVDVLLQIHFRRRGRLRGNEIIYDHETQINAGRSCPDRCPYCRRDVDREPAASRAGDGR